MRALLAAASASAALIAAGASPAATTPNECRGLMICVAVVGPWVAAAPTQVQYLLTCPRGYVVGGTDAELSDRAIDVVFLGNQGSPVNPGITTTREAVFVGTYVGTAPRSGPTFRPHIGCIPAGGGGGRVPTAVGAFPPGRPLARHARTVAVAPGTARVPQGCLAGERLVSGWHAVGFRGSKPPAAELVRGVSAAQSLRAGRVVVTVRAGSRAVLQVGAVCAGGR